MDLLLESHIHVKLFVGCMLTSEIRMYLLQSMAWKQAKITPNAEPLLEIRYEGLDYLGKYLPMQSLPLKELQKIEQDVVKEIHTYCPQLNERPLKFFVFPQLFIQ